MSSQVVAEALERELGAGALERHAPLELDGVAIAATLRPEDPAALAWAIGALGRLGLACVVRGAGRHLGLGNPPQRADLFLSTEHLAGVDALEPAEGVCHAQAGVRLGELRRRVTEEGWELPLAGSDDDSLGGVLAGALLGPRSHGFGPPRDAVLGLDVVLGSGERTRCGGRVVKNVTGYDLAKLYVGSLGTLAVIEGAWLRLRPRPESTVLLSTQPTDLESACAFAARAARCVTSRACGLLGRSAAGYRCVVELAGDAEGVAHDAANLGGETAEPDALDALSALQAPGADAFVLRLAALPAALPGLARTLADLGAEIALHPGLRLLYARLACEGGADRLAAVERAARGASAALRVEAAPADLKRDRDVFAAGESEVRLTRALKQRYDPQGVLAPGRAAGCT